jgi:hypothetical protein
MAQRRADASSRFERLDTGKCELERATSGACWYRRSMAGAQRRKERVDVAVERAVEIEHRGDARVAMVRSSFAWALVRSTSRPTIATKS